MMMQRQRIYLSIIFSAVALLCVGGGAILLLNKSKKKMLRRSEAYTTASVPQLVPSYKVTDSISAETAIVMDGKTGQVLMAKDADRTEYPASMTKMMTCLLAIESGKLDSVVTLTHYINTYTYLARGDRLTMSQLLPMMMLISDNGAAITIADYLSQGKGSFTDMMNKKAREIGMMHTHFANPDGLHDDSHYSTARDMATLARYCMHNADFRRIVAMRDCQIQWIRPAGKHISCHNENRLIHSMEGVDGVKTGYTKPARGCVAISYEKDGTSYIVVVMHSLNVGTRFRDAKRLIDTLLAQRHQTIV